MGSTWEGNAVGSNDRAGKWSLSFWSIMWAAGLLALAAAALPSGPDSQAYAAGAEALPSGPDSQAYAPGTEPTMPQQQQQQQQRQQPAAVGW